MIDRRGLLAGGFGLAVSAFSGSRLVSAKRKPLRAKAQYVSCDQPYPGDLNTFSIFVYARGLDLKHVRKSRQPVQVSLPLPAGSFSVVARDHNPAKRFNLNGFEARSGRYGAYVPLTGTPIDRIVVHVYVQALDTIGPGRYRPRQYLGRGRAGKWIWLSRKQGASRPSQ